nr:MAG TPA: hypothetical protein [Caudoviricetes sp.]
MPQHKGCTVNINISPLHFFGGYYFKEGRK